MRNAEGRLNVKINTLVEAQDTKGSIQTYQRVSAKSLADTLPGLRRGEEMECSPAEERTGGISPKLMRLKNKTTVPDGLLTKTSTPRRPQNCHDINENYKTKYRQRINH